MSDNSQQHKSKFHYTYLIVLTGIVITSIPCAMVISCAGIYFNPVSSYFGVSTAEVSLYFSILNIAMMITVPIAGKFMSTADLHYFERLCTNRWTDTYNNVLYKCGLAIIYCWCIARDWNGSFDLFGNTYSY